MSPISNMNDTIKCRHVDLVALIISFVLVFALCLANSFCFSSKNDFDIKHGGTPLHWAKSKEIIEALIESGCKVEAKNFNGKTALHVMVEHQRLDCIIALVTMGDANINTKNKDGNTSLHLAVEVASTAIVKALLALEADTTLVNDKGETAWALAQKKCDEKSMMDFLDREGVLYALYAVGASGSSTPVDKKGNEMDFKKIRQALQPQQKRIRCLFDEMLAKKSKKLGKNKTAGKGRLLSLDGGGIKGVVLARMLMSMERIFQTPIVHCFDWIAGTSTGGILALALATGKTPFECLLIYLRLKDKVFVDSKPYSSKPLEEMLQKEFGTETKLFDIKVPKIILTATMADRSPPDLHLFRNYTSPQEMLGITDFDHPELTSHHVASEQLVWRAAKATGAAPSFFRPEGRYVDGGIMANNPSMALLTEIAEYNAAKRAMDEDEEIVEPSVLVSLGTGTPPVQKIKVVDIFRPDSASDTLKLIMNYDGMGKLMLDSVLDADGLPVDHARAWCLSTKTAYHRLSPLMLKDIELDEKDDRQIVDLLWSTMAYMHSKKDDILLLRDELLPPNEAKQAEITEN